MHALRATSVDTTFAEKIPDLGYCIMSYIIAVNGTEIHIWFFFRKISLVGIASKDHNCGLFLEEIWGPEQLK